jgi:hypothetical protein
MTRGQRRFSMQTLGSRGHPCAICKRGVLEEGRWNSTSSSQRGGNSQSQNDRDEDIFRSGQALR